MGGCFYADFFFLNSFSGLRCKRSVCVCVGVRLQAAGCCLFPQLTITAVSRLISSQLILLERRSSEQRMISDKHV